MGASKYYDVLLDGVLLYSGPIRTAKLVYDCLFKCLELLHYDKSVKLVLAFHM